MENISFVTLLAYDYKYAFESIRSYYDFADEIILGIDEDCISWSGNKFYINYSEIENFIAKTDISRKIKIIRGNFHNLLSPAKNDTNERNYLSLKCKPGNWIIQIDSDEILVNPKIFFEWLRNISDGFTVKAYWTTIFKCFEGSPYCLVIDNGEETSIGTKKQNAYTFMRDTNEKTLQSPLNLLHFSWGRTRNELKQKLDNWGHSKDFDTKAYLEFWDKINLNNYKQFKNINPVNPPAWPKLKAVKIDEILNSKNYSCSPSIRVKIISSFIFLLFWTTFRKLKVFFK